MYTVLRFALLYDGFQVDGSRGRLCFQGGEDDEYMASIDTCIRDVDYNKTLQYYPAGDFVDAYTRSCVHASPWARTHAANTYKYFWWWALLHVMMEGPCATT